MNEVDLFVFSCKTYQIVFIEKSFKYIYTYYLCKKETKTREISTLYVCVNSEKTVLEETHQINDNDYLY